MILCVVFDEMVILGDFDEVGVVWEEIYVMGYNVGLEVCCLIYKFKE